MTPMLQRLRLGLLSTAAIGLTTALVATTGAPARAEDACTPHKIDLGEGKSMMGGCASSISRC